MFDEPGSFYICTETSPRCYIIQKVSARHVDQVVNQLNKQRSYAAAETDHNGDMQAPGCGNDYYYADSAGQPTVGAGAPVYPRPPGTPPPLPCLPYWFTPQAEAELVSTTGGIGVATMADFPVAAVATATARVPQQRFDDAAMEEDDVQSPLRILVDNPTVSDQNMNDASQMCASTPSGSSPLANQTGGSASHGGSPAGRNAMVPLQSKPTTRDELIKQLRVQMEYYFSPDNLRNDRYLWTQMDGDQYVSVKILASFPRVVNLTTDVELIKDAIRASDVLQLDDKEERVRAPSRRCTIILRDIPDSTEKTEIESLFTHDECPEPTHIEYGLNSIWYVTFANDDDTKRALMYLYSHVKTFKSKQICARIKTSKTPVSSNGQQPVTNTQSTTVSASQHSAGTQLSSSQNRSVAPPNSLPGLLSPTQLPAASQNELPAEAAAFGSSSWSPSHQPIFSIASTPSLYPVAQFDLGPQLDQAGFQLAGVYRPSLSVIHHSVVHMIPNSTTPNGVVEHQQPQQPVVPTLRRVSTPGGTAAPSNSTMNVNAPSFHPNQPYLIDYPTQTNKHADDSRHQRSNSSGYNNGNYRGGRGRGSSYGGGHYREGSNQHSGRGNRHSGGTDRNSSGSSGAGVNNNDVGGGGRYQQQSSSSTSFRNARNARNSDPTNASNRTTNKNMSSPRGGNQHWAAGDGEYQQPQQPRSSHRGRGRGGNRGAGGAPHFGSWRSNRVGSGGGAFGSRANNNNQNSYSSSYGQTPVDVRFEQNYFGGNGGQQAASFGSNNHHHNHHKSSNGDVGGYEGRFGGGRYSDGYGHHHTYMNGGGPAGSYGAYWFEQMDCNNHEPPDDPNVDAAATTPPSSQTNERKTKRLAAIDMTMKQLDDDDGDVEHVAVKSPARFDPNDPQSFPSLVDKVTDSDACDGSGTLEGSNPDNVDHTVNDQPKAPLITAASVVSGATKLNRTNAGKISFNESQHSAPSTQSAESRSDNTKDSNGTGEPRRISYAAMAANNKQATSASESSASSAGGPTDDKRSTESIEKQ